MSNDAATTEQTASPAPAPAAASPTLAPAAAEVKADEGAAVAQTAAETEAKAKAEADAKAKAETEAKAKEDAEKQYSERRQKDNEAQVAQLVTTWAEESKVDPEIGGDQFDANLALAKKAVDSFFPEFKEVLEKTGLGSHKDFIRGFVRIGKVVSEDKFVPGTKAAEPKSIGAVLYDKTPR